jgi:MarR family 2-MHQ and catechol resistance regulon transcriptional repressor
MGTRYKGTPREVLALDGFIKLMRATDSVSAHLSRHTEAAGLTTGQFGVLEALLHVGPMGQRDLGAKLLRSGSNVTMVLDNLERRGLVRRTRRKDDRRAIEVALTAGGRRLINALFPEHARRITRLFGALSSRDQQRLGALCKTLGRNIPGGSA